MRYSSTKFILLISTTLPAMTFAAQKNVETNWSNPMLWFLIAIIILLAFAISALAGSIKNLSNGAKYDNTDEKKNNSGKIAGIGLLMLLSFNSLSAAEPIYNGAEPIMGIPFGQFYFLMAVILIEIIILFVLINVLKLRYAPAVKAIKSEAAPKEKTILEIINASVEIEKEEAIMMDHDYDGIHELDNSLPPWWKYGFYLTIFVGIVYLVHYHVTETGDLQVAELEKSIKLENEKITAYLKESANNVDETSVKLLDNPQDLASGKETFLSLCSTCHGRSGEGSVGPNLTDDYWIHGGGIADIFKSVKYGWTDKGMRSWKDELSPVKIAQVSSFIKSLRGSNPPNGKPKEGELFIEAGSKTTGDSTAKLSADSSSAKDSSLVK